MNELVHYISDVLGIHCNVVPIPDNELERLPLFMKHEYDFMKGDISGHEILFIKPKKGVEITAVKLRKHLDIASKALKKTSVYVIESLEGYNRKRLINKKVPFVVPGKQMYMPDLLIDLKDFAVVRKQKPETMTPAAQLLLLYHLQVEQLEGMNMKSIARKLGYGAMTITRVANYLKTENICKIEGTKEKYLLFDKTRQALWKEVEPHMFNPVKKTVYVSGKPSLNEVYRSNINALSYYTLIADENKDYYAITDKSFKQFINTGLIKDYGNLDGEVCLEIWKYDPGKLSNNNYVDRLSLYLIFREDQNERIQIVLDQMMEEILW
ncbi:MAG: hypothetical protein PHD61_07795 [Bacteroidales bacterium]|nr:hypothetical protein [Lentimicrobiaceae bacterium]MDD5695193.1 hypothetical protein [Bacteroidales bacterium]